MMKRFRNRTEVAAYLKISRTTLNRWEKKLPLMDRVSGLHIMTLDQWEKKLPLMDRVSGSHVNGIRKDTVDSWVQKLMDI